MLNKELLMAGITTKEPHIILTVDDYYNPDFSASGYGYSDYDGAGAVSRIPCWGRYGTIKNYAALKTLATLGGRIQQTIIWTPLRTNLSRRLLRRRSSLGGSKC